MDHSSATAPFPFAKVGVEDSVALNKAKKYVNLREYIKKCKKRWGMKSEEAKQRWKDLLADPKIPKTNDQMGWVTMPALHVFEPRAWYFDPHDCKGISFPLLLVQAHFSVSPRSVGQRKVTHSGLLRTSQVEQTDEAGLHNLAKSLNLSGFYRAIGHRCFFSFELHAVCTCCQLRCFCH